ncbi:hypothetical protein OHT61_32010 [Streptomyces sp. NBC_00178]|uniref:hypothetical protein n=1 Tax=Streptomyces sp. NBC_00178 TaxID=2975672 RepID=UPI002E28C02A|nr:hypothetical protein [Streptomyces sp. NBC_00178]
MESPKVMPLASDAVVLGERHIDLRFQRHDRDRVEFPGGVITAARAGFERWEASDVIRQLSPAGW